MRAASSRTRRSTPPKLRIVSLCLAGTGRASRAPARGAMAAVEPRAGSAQGIGGSRPYGISPPTAVRRRQGQDERAGREQGRGAGPRGADDGGLARLARAAEQHLARGSEQNALPGVRGHAPARRSTRAGSRATESSEEGSRRGVYRAGGKRLPESFGRHWMTGVIWRYQGVTG